METEVIENAIIESVSIDTGDRNLLTVWLYLDYGGCSQGFGGYALYLPKGYANHSDRGFAGHFIFRCMEVAGVESWAKMQGKTIRVKRTDGSGIGSRITAIGHIVKNDWFNPTLEFAALDKLKWPGVN